MWDRMEMPNEYLIGIDTDWASEAMISETARLLQDRGMKATWFVTHGSPETARLSGHPGLFEVGVHPNFSPDSTQGRSPEEIMRNLKRTVPAAVSVRTHRLLQSTPLLRLMREDFGMLYDASIHLPLTRNIVPHELHFKKDASMIRIPTFWEDGLELVKPAPCFSFKDASYHLPGIKIFVFHPIHVFLNSTDHDSYLGLKASMNFKDSNADDIQRYINRKDRGIKDLFLELLDFMKHGSFNRYCLAELALSWSNGQRLS
jgi:hypothetical protein